MAKLHKIKPQTHFSPHLLSFSAARAFSENGVFSRKNFDKEPNPGKAGSSAKMS
jgi:hypothetical protein